jgi:hypothetical protein
MRRRWVIKITKKHLLIGCLLGVGLALIKWAMPRYTEINMQFSEPLPDGSYVVAGFSGITDHIRIKHGKTYHVT